MLNDIYFGNLIQRRANIWQINFARENAPLSGVVIQGPWKTAETPEDMRFIFIRQKLLSVEHLHILNLHDRGLIQMTCL